METPKNEMTLPEGIRKKGSFWEIDISLRSLADLFETLTEVPLPYKQINPEIVSESEEKTTYSEGCLSIPGIYCDVVRPKKMTVRYYNEDLQEVTEEFDNFACRMIQHEMSHLDGDLFTDHAAPIRKKMISGKLQNITKGKVHPHYNSRLK